MGREHEWQLVGGDVVLDLCNTRSWRGDPARNLERLDSPAAFATWRNAVRQTHSLELAPITDDGELVRVRRLRDLVLALLDTSGTGNDAHRLAPGGLQELTAMWVTAASRNQPAGDLPLRWLVDPSVSTAACDELAFRAVDLLRGDLGHVRRCGLAECGWYFVDTTRNHSRRWCTPTECGNLHRTRAYARRRP